MSPEVLSSLCIIFMMMASRKVGNLLLISKMTVRDAYEVFGNCLDVAPRVLDISPMQR